MAGWVGMFALGIVASAAAAVATFYVTFAGDESPETAGPGLDILFVYTLFVGVPAAVVLWRWRSGNGRAFGAALGLCWIAGAVVWLVPVTPAPEPDEGERSVEPLELEGRLREEVAGSTTLSTPIYYLGREFRGEALSDVVALNSGGEAGADRILEPGTIPSIMYGDRLRMETVPFSAADYNRGVDCQRLPSLRGVPTVQQADAVLLFTGSVVVRLLGDFADDPEQAAEAATALREPTRSGPTGADLPAPPARIAALVDEVCGPTP